MLRQVCTWQALSFYEHTAVTSPVGQIPRQTNGTTDSCQYYYYYYYNYYYYWGTR